MGYAYLHGGKPIEYIIDTYVDNSTEAWEWIYDMGVKDYDFVTDEDGSKAIINSGHMPYDYKRTYVPLPKEGSEISNPAIEVMEKRIDDEDKIKVYTSVEGRKLLHDDKGHVNGAEGLSADGKKIHFKASKGVIMTTGGYAGNPLLFEEYSADLNNLISAALPSGDGYGLKMMQELGASLTDEAMEWIETYPKGILNKNSTTTGTNGSTGTYYTGGILVNINGERFVNEVAWDDEVRNAALKEQPENYMYEIYTDEIFEATKDIQRGMYDAFTEGGRYEDYIISGDSLEELAENIDVPVDTFVETVNKYNEHVETKTVDEFGREFEKKENENRVEAINKIEGDKFYAVRIQPIVLSSRGGILVNDLNQVMTKDEVVIPGLYAAGEVVGQMWGKTIAPGVAMNGVMAFGRFAAKNIMTIDQTDEYAVTPAANTFEESLFEKADTDVSKGAFEDLKDGNYTGSAEGMNGDIEVKVTVEDGKVSKIEITNHEETPGISDLAIENIPEDIIEAQSSEVDSYSSATVTSVAIMEAVKDALN